jgi:hypothetical protein
VRRKISVVGGAELAQVLADRDYADVVRVGAGDDLSGSDVVVLAEPGEELFDDIRVRAPNAVVVAVGLSPRPVCEATLFPRARIVGVGGDTDYVAQAIDSIVLDRGRVFDCVVRLEGERGVDGEFGSVPVRLGAGGVAEIVD